MSQETAGCSFALKCFQGMHFVWPLFNPEKISSKVKQKLETYISPSSSPQIGQNIQTLFFEDIFCFVPSRSRDQGLTLCTHAAIFKYTLRPGRGVKQEEAKYHKAFISLISYSFLKYSICFFSTTLTIFQSYCKVASDSFCIIFWTFCRGSRPLDLPTLPFCWL